MKVQNMKTEIALYVTILHYCSSPSNIVLQFTKMEIALAISFLCPSINQIRADRHSNYRCSHSVLEYIVAVQCQREIDITETINSRDLKTQGYTA